ncbi:MAG: radical SAM family heme chaperone HemW [Alphaproteobacteria bacterium]|nr:radical SAM family heme chaperone HemW [Alphaproteobacteria bacterium]
MADKSPLGIYLHWGFCASKCPYCDFVSQKLPSDLDFSLWLTEYKKALDFFVPFTANHEVTSVFFGGGTPSLLPPSFVGEILDYIRKRFNFSSVTEITLEANPSSSESKKFADLKSAGINRLSLGVQSFSDASLKFLGRIHSREEAITALKNALNIFTNVSFDLIYALPNQEISQWRQELSEALSYKSPHLSLYQLTIEPECAFARQNISLPDEDTAAALYETAGEMTEKAGIPAYEVSNYARPGYESVHNLAYWRYHDYLGIGPSAHGRLSINGQKHALCQHSDPFFWLKATDKNAEDIILTPAEVIEEVSLMGLRTTEGISEKLLPSKHLQTLLSDGLLMRKGNRICATKNGILLLNKVLSRLFAD